MNNLHPLFQTLLEPSMRDAHTEDLNLHLKSREAWCEAQEKATVRILDGDFQFDDLMEGIKRYWPQIRKCLSDREDDECHTFIMKGLMDELAERELDE